MAEMLALTAEISLSLEYRPNNLRKTKLVVLAAGAFVGAVHGSTLDPMPGWEFRGSL